MSRGGRNLIILGIVSILITCVMSGISLFIYTASGDIYLDRSRPGFLPEKSEFSSENLYKLSEDGDITNEVIDEYLENLKKIRADVKPDTFSPDALSNKNLGIPEK